MTAATLEQRIEALEDEVRQLRAAVKKGEREQPWWERVGGMFKDDPLFDEIVRAGQKYRRSQNRCDHSIAERPSAVAKS
jgi:hypothetical protein